MTRSEGHIPSRRDERRSPRDPDPDRRADDRSGHPTGRAALLLIGVTLLIVLLAALSSFGHL